MYSAFHSLNTIWLFTLSDLKTIVGPKTTFGILSTLAGPVLTTNPSPALHNVVRAIPRTMFWTWINLLPFAIDNQRQPSAIKEDAMNKPWRPMPSKRLSERAAFNLVLVLYPAAIISSFYFGALRQCLTLLMLGYWYNDLGGADRNFLIRNFINACGFICYASGATEVASQSSLWSSQIKQVTINWLLLIGAVVLTSVQTQDMYDQAGDRARGRKTLPLVIGDYPARWTIAVSMVFWSVIGPTFWELGVISYTSSMALGTVIALRSLLKTSVADDRRTFRLWNAWMVLLYLMPLLKRIEG